MTLRKSGFGLWFLLAVLFGLGAAFLVVTSVAAVAQTERVVVAVREIPAHSQLGASDVRLEEVPRAAVPADALRRVDQAVGRWTRGLVLGGEVLRAAHLAEESGPRSTLGAGLASMGDPGVRAMAIPVGDETSVGGELRKGDRVDLLAVVNVTIAGQQVTLSKVIAAGVPVLAAPEPGSDPMRPSSGGALVVAVRPELAEDIAYVLGAGKLYVLLNPYSADESAANTSGVVPQTFLGKYGYALAGGEGR